MLLFLGCFRPGFGVVQHLHLPHTHFSLVRDRAVTEWTVRNEGNKDQPPLLEMFAYMNPQAGWKAKITSFENCDGSTQRGWGRSGQAYLRRAKRAPLCRESEHKFGFFHSTPACCPLSSGPEPVLGLCSPFLCSHSSLLGSPTPGRTHRVTMELLFPGVSQVGPARRAVPGSPKEAVYIAGMVI